MELVRPIRAVLVGEGMIELSRSGGGWVLGHGGDTLNTAIHLARFGLDTAYMTALGDDPFSNELRMAWAAEGLDTRLILTDPARQPGLYAIRTDDMGERSFSYWRNDSAAKRLFALPGSEEAVAQAERADLLCYSLISLAILPPESRNAVFDLCRRVRERGGKVAFDGNYRARLWVDVREAQAARDTALTCADIGLPTLEDEMLLSGSSDADSIAAHWSQLGVGEVIVKLGVHGCRLPDGSILPPPAVLAPVDTSGAGDAFNAGYLQARISGQAPADAALAAHRLAGWVVTQPGAIPMRRLGAPYGSDTA